MIRTESVFETWKAIREDTAKTVEEMPVTAFDTRPAPDVMTFRELALHVLNSSHAVMGMMLDGMQDFTQPEFRARLRDYLPAQPADGELAGALRARLDERLEQLRAQPPEFLAQIVTRFDGAQVTRLEFVQMMKEHELTHRSQMFVAARVAGVVPVTTRRRQQQQKK
jgi:uncharacterized damage-inducible protein DinB